MAGPTILQPDERDFKYAVKDGRLGIITGVLTTGVTTKLGATTKTGKDGKGSTVWDVTTDQTTGLAINGWKDGDDPLPRPGNLVQDTVTNKWYKVEPGVELIESNEDCEKVSVPVIRYEDNDFPVAPPAPPAP